MTRHCFALVVGCLLAACQPATEPTRAGAADFDPERQLGWLHGHCLAIKNAELAPGTAVLVVRLDAPQRLVNALIQGAEPTPQDCPALLDDRREVNLAAGYRLYPVEVSGAPLEAGIAVLGPTAAPREVDGQVEADLNGDGRPERFSVCATTEGINYEVSTKPPGPPTVLWSGYEYLGYDLEPTCPER